MAKDKVEKKSTPNAFVAFFKSEPTHYVCGIILLFLVVYLFFAMFSFLFTAGADQSVVTSGSVTDLKCENWTGFYGAKLSNSIINNGFGIASFALLLFPLVVAFRIIGIRIMPIWKSFVLSSVITIWGSLFFSFFFYNFYKEWALKLGGDHGKVVSDFLFERCGWGTLLIVFVLLLIILLICSSKTILWIKHLFTPRQKTQVDEVVVKSEQDEEPVVVEVVDEPKDDVKVEDEPIEIVDTPIDVKNEEEPQQQPDPQQQTVQQGDSNGELVIEIEEPLDTDVAKDDPDYLLKKYGKYDPHLDLSHYKMPPLSILKTYPNENVPVVDMEEQNANKERIVHILKSFSIEVVSIKATVGPTITLYEIVPKEGTPVSKIRRLENDIMLSLKAMGIRIIAPIPGKGTVGIEVPNEKPQIVSMHSVLASKRFQEEEKFALPVALGRTITNEVFMFDLAKSPHLLVAGATGQGKSVGLNAIITSLLYKKHPSELKFVLIDPKMVEFSIYSKLEKYYMATMPDQEKVIIIDSKKVIQTLNSLVVEMEDRYKLLESVNCRNIIEYNEKFVNRRLNPEKGHRYLPYIVIVIDEYGDFIMVAGKDVETPISRIAQKARAVGMHLILATQRPSVNIITGIIKANVPGRIAFKVSQMVDSRTILDAAGAQQLVGKGDLLYNQNGELVRVQCAFVDTPEVEAVVDYISKQQSYTSAYMLPEYDMNESADLNVSGVDMTKRDPLFEEAARYVVSLQQASTSNIQRKFSIGFNRAGRIVDQLNSAGIIGPQEGSKPRRVLVASEMELDMLLQQGLN